MKKILAILCSLLILLSFTACSASSFDSNKTAQVRPTDPMVPYMESDFSVDGGAFADDLKIEEYSNNVHNPDAPVDTSRKLIKTYNIDAQTMEFDQLIPTLQNEVTRLGGYIEYSEISGNGYSYRGTRCATFTIRIPEDKANEFVNTIDGNANITSKNENVEDITLTYVDTESRIKTLNTEYERLLELLEKAEDIGTIIALEERLSLVRYQLESYNSQLRTFDNQINYSTIHLFINEVERITETEPVSIWERIKNDFDDNVYDVWLGLQDFFVWFVSSIPYFVIFLIVILIIVLIIKALCNLSPRYRAKKAYKKQLKQEKKAAKKAQKEKVENNTIPTEEIKEDPSENTEK